jgi:hypothetical protein
VLADAEVYGGVVDAGLSGDGEESAAVLLGVVAPVPGVEVWSLVTPCRGVTPWTRPWVARSAIERAQPLAPGGTQATRGAASNAALIFTRSRSHASGRRRGEGEWTVSAVQPEQGGSSAADLAPWGPHFTVTPMSA